MSLNKRKTKQKAKYKEYEDFGKLPSNLRSYFGGYIAYVELAETWKNDEVIHDYYRLKAEKMRKRIEKRLMELGRI
jgi:hypothetical protein